MILYVIEIDTGPSIAVGPKNEKRAEKKIEKNSKYERNTVKCSSR